MKTLGTMENIGNVSLDEVYKSLKKGKKTNFNKLKKNYLEKDPSHLEENFLEYLFSLREKELKKTLKQVGLTQTKFDNLISDIKSYFSEHYLDKEEEESTAVDDAVNNFKKEVITALSNYAGLEREEVESLILEYDYLDVEESISLLKRHVPTTLGIKRRAATIISQLKLRFAIDFMLIIERQKEVSENIELELD